MMRRIAAREVHQAQAIERTELGIERQKYLLAIDGRFRQLRPGHEQLLALASA